MWALTCCPVGVLLVLLLLLGFFSCLLKHLIIWAIRRLEEGLQLLREQIVPAYPLGNAVCNAAWTDRGKGKKKSHSTQNKDVEKDKTLSIRCSIFQRRHFLDGFHLKAWLFSSAAHLCLPPAGSLLSTVWLSPRPLPWAKAPRAEFAGPTRPPTGERKPATVPVLATPPPSLAATGTNKRHLSPTACKCDHVKNKCGAKVLPLMLHRKNINCDGLWQKAECNSILLLFLGNRTVFYGTER